LFSPCLPSPSDTFPRPTNSFAWCIVKSTRVPITTVLTDIGTSSSIGATSYRHCEQSPNIPADENFGQMKMKSWTLTRVPSRPANISDDQTPLLTSRFPRNARTRKSSRVRWQFSVWSIPTHVGHLCRSRNSARKSSERME
jgi:hypothetical protein